MRDSNPDQERLEELFKQSSRDPSAVSSEELRAMLQSAEGESLHKLGIIFVRLSEATPLQAAEVAESAWAAMTTDDPKGAKIITVGMCRICESHPREIEAVRDDISSILDELATELDSFDLFSAPEDTSTEAFEALAAVIELAYHFEQNDFRILPEMVDDVADFLTMRCTPNLRQMTLTFFDLVGKKYPELAFEYTEELEAVASTSPTAEDERIQNWIAQPDRTTRLDIQHLATRTIQNIASVDASEVRHCVDTLHDNLSAEHPYIRASAAYGLAEIGYDYPSETLVAVDELRGLLHTSHTSVVFYSAYALGEIAKEYPDEVLSCYDTIAEDLQDGFEGGLINHTHVLDVLASHYPSEVRSIAEEVIKHITDDRMLVRKNVVSYFHHLQPTFPELIAEYIELFEERLDDPSEEVSSIAADVVTTYENSDD